MIKDLVKMVEIDILDEVWLLLETSQGLGLNIHKNLAFLHSFDEVCEQSLVDLLLLVAEHQRLGRICIEGNQFQAVVFYLDLCLLNQLPAELVFFATDRFMKSLYLRNSSRSKAHSALRKTFLTHGLLSRQLQRVVGQGSDPQESSPTDPGPVPGSKDRCSSESSSLFYRVSRLSRSGPFCRFF